MTKPAVTALLLLLPLSLPAQQGVQHARDGGTKMHIDSIDIPAIPNAPFSAVVVTEITTMLPDGSKKITGNHRLVARDSSGRVFQERRGFSPKGLIEPTRLTQSQFDDPGREERLLCATPKNCDVYPFEHQFKTPALGASLPPLVKLANGTTIKNEDLGTGQREGVEAVGSRETTTIAAGVVGNEKPIEVVKEFWYSPQLGINVFTSRMDPRLWSLQTFTVTQINRSEPDPRLFAPPADAKLTPCGCKAE